MYIYIYTEWTYHGFTIDAESGSADAAFKDFFLPIPTDFAIKGPALQESPVNFGICGYFLSLLT